MLALGAGEADPRALLGWMGRSGKTNRRGGTRGRCLGSTFLSERRKSGAFDALAPSGRRGWGGRSGKGREAPATVGALDFLAFLFGRDAALPPTFGTRHDQQAREPRGAAGWLFRGDKGGCAVGALDRLSAERFEDLRLVPAGRADADGHDAPCSDGRTGKEGFAPSRCVPDPWTEGQPIAASHNSPVYR